MTTGRVNAGGSSGGSALLNIFTQPTEPKRKDGIWIETPSKFKDINFQQTVYKSNTIAHELTFPAANAAEAPLIVINGDYLYFWGHTGYMFVCKKYSFKDKVWSEVKKATPEISKGRGYVENGKIILFSYDGSSTSGAMTVFEFNPVDETYKTIGTYTIGRSLSFDIVKLGDEVRVSTISTATGYYFGLRVINLATGENKVIATPNLPNAISTTVSSVGDKHYRFSTVTYMFDEQTRTHTLLAPPPAEIKGFASAVVVGADIYLSGGDSTSVAVYHTETDTWELLGTNMAQKRSNHTSYFSEQHKAVYLVTGYITRTSVNNTTIELLKFEDKQFNQNELIIQYIESLLVGKIKAQLFTANAKIKNVKLVTPFENVWLFKDGKLNEYPTYYGDGTRWVKFKN